MEANRVSGRMKRVLRRVLTAGLCFAGIAHAADFRVWTDQKGNTVEARFIQMSGPKVVLEKEDRTRIMVPKAGLCESDQAYLADVIPPELDFVVDLDKDRRKLSQGYSYVRREESINFSVTIKKTNDDKCTRKFKAYLYLLAESEQANSNYGLIARKEHAFDFMESDATQLEISETLRNSEFSSGSYGWVYDGYVIVVKDESGAVVATNSNKDLFVKKIDVIEKNKRRYYGFEL